MTDSEINKIVSRLLRERLRDFGFKRSAVHSEQDFDGSSILRITAYLRKPGVPASQLTDALHEIRTKLLSKGEERFILLSSESPEEEMIDEDVE
jgi:hypothetical protein